MIFLMILLLATAVAAVTRPGHGARNWARLGLGAAFIVAGFSHLARPEPFEQHLPAWIPAEGAIVAATGLIEIVLGAAFIVWSSRKRQLGLVATGYLVAVLPANIYVAVADVEVDGLPRGAFAWLRIPLQGVFIAWALFSTTTTTRQPPLGQPRPRRFRDSSRATARPTAPSERHSR